MDNDDKQVGRILNRRELVALLGVAGAALLVKRASGQAGHLGHATGLGSVGASGTPALPACVVRPAQTEGPYFIDEKLNRSDIRTDPTGDAKRDGVRLDVEMRVSRVDARACTPIAGAMVDLWQCDAIGVYSDVLDTGGRFDTRRQKFLRGYQLTDADGIARFTTIYPGWYEGRTAHVHFKVRHLGREFTSQLYFEDAQSDEIFAKSPYATNTQRRMRNGQDRIFRNGGNQLLMSVEKRGAALGGTFDIGLELG
jgi:protocatechuate 3,4-dioxygenase beta subunit